MKSKRPSTGISIRFENIWLNPPEKWQIVECNSKIDLKVRSLVNLIEFLYDIFNDNFIMNMLIYLEKNLEKNTTIS